MAVSIGKRHQLRRALLSWYDANQRDLPWRHTRDPYRIWISEIMLQQTRVAVVMERYRRFLKRFPSVGILARARESSVLAEWSGLGYYRRARNLQAAAKVIMRDHKGKFPRSADTLQNLPGVGRYTAAAIASIAFGETIAVVDGNVERVLARLLGHEQRGESKWATAQDLLDKQRSGDFNQAMMELGATVCLPVQPACRSCPIKKFCSTRGRGHFQKSKGRQQRRRVAYLLGRHAGSVLLLQRPADNRLMPGMWELPEVTPSNGAGNHLFSVKHSITATDFKVDVVSSSTEQAVGTWVRISRLNALPLTGLARKILRRAEVI